MKIKEVSKRYNMTPDTLRYYERIGLIHDVQRSSNGIRDYSEENCRNIEFVKCMREAGVSIEGLIQYMALYQQGKSTVTARKKILMAEKERITERIQLASKALDRLDYKLKCLDEEAN